MKLKNNPLVDLALEMKNYDWLKRLVEQENEDIETEKANVDDLKYTQHKALQDIDELFVVIEDHGVMKILPSELNEISKLNIGMIFAEKHTQDGFVNIKESDTVYIWNADSQSVVFSATLFYSGMAYHARNQSNLLSNLFGGIKQ